MRGKQNPPIKTGVFYLWKAGDVYMGVLEKGVNDVKKTKAKTKRVLTP